MRCEIDLDFRVSDSGIGVLLEMVTERQQWGEVPTRTSRVVVRGRGLMGRDYSNGSENVRSARVIPPDATSTGTVTRPKNSCQAVSSYVPGGTPARE